MRVTKPTNNANISLLLIVTFLIACMVNNAYAFNQPVVNADSLSDKQLNRQATANVSANQNNSTAANSSTSAQIELYDASYVDNSNGVCKLTEKLLQKASTHMDELVMVILMIIMFSHYFMRQTPNVISLSTRFVPSQRRHLILCKFDE
ncbi:hypothetical protein [Moritella sp. Urea-trap-13]|uniref:hypothetical protein n=1 Tax=Moritella sp. Urea-trap-13 TaxID=2058327 RepID=UPI000C3252A1|nr:hypothetical protein [Moritella sp. Urea-trap-13]PKH08058.1 hypothetical protein CXF93_05110 [Moritella sp. Urea-trap-13]